MSQLHGFWTYAEAGNGLWCWHSIFAHDKILQHNRLFFEALSKLQWTELSGAECNLPTIPPSYPDLVAPGTTTGVSAGPLPVPEDVQLLSCVLGRRQHVQVALFLTEPARVLTEAQGQDCVNIHTVTGLLAVHGFSSSSGVSVNTHHPQNNEQQVKDLRLRGATLFYSISVFLNSEDWKNPISIL